MNLSGWWMESPEIIVYSKPDCCLCDQVKKKLQELQELYQFVWREINILDDPAAFESFQFEIPVVFIDGRKVFKYHLDEERFIRLLGSAVLKRRAGAEPAS